MNMLATNMHVINQLCTYMTTVLIKSIHTLLLYYQTNSLTSSDIQYSQSYTAEISGGTSKIQNKNAQT